MRTSKARTGLRARLACHRRWSVYGKQLPSYTRGGSRMRESRPYGSVRGARDETRVPTATTRTKDDSKVSGTTIPRHFQCKKCRFDGLKNETNNSRRFIRSSHRRACAVSGLPPITPTIRRLQQPTGNPPALSPSSLASEICPARKRTSSASGASHVSQGNPARREVGAATSAACLRRQWSATALTELSEAIARPGVAVIGVQRDAAQKRLGRVIARAVESRARAGRMLR